jgi:hypothetical protein
MPGSRCRPDDSGASVIIGTLMIILVVVIGAAGLALMMSTAQKEQMNRQAHQNAVKNEKLDIDRIVLLPNTTTPDKWAFVNFTIVNMDINDATVTIVGLYDQVNRTYRYPTSVAARSSIGSAALYTLMLEGSTPRYADTAGIMLRIPGKKSLDICINLSNFSEPAPVLQTRDEIRLILYTLLLNNFEKRFIPPIPLMKITVETEDLGVARRDYILLDGSGSSDDGSITSWNWTVKDDGPRYYEGKTVQVRFASEGPFTVNLTVTDDTMMKGITADYRIPSNPKFNPPTSLAVNATLYPTISARITSIEGAGVISAPVDFLIDANPFGNITLSVYSNTTDALGYASTSVSGGPGRIKVVSGDLPPVYVPVS